MVLSAENGTLDVANVPEFGVTVITPRRKVVLPVGVEIQISNWLAVGTFEAVCRALVD